MFEIILSTKPSFEEIRDLLSKILGSLHSPDFEVLHPDQVARLRGDFGPKIQLKELRHLAEIYEEEQNRLRDLNTFTRSLSLLPLEEKGKLYRPLTYRASFARRQEVRGLRSNLRELDVRFEQELASSIDHLRSSGLVRGRKRREKPKKEYARPWETAKVTSTRVNLDTENRTPRRPPKPGAKKRGVKCKKGK